MTANVFLSSPDATPLTKQEWFWPYWFLVPIYPYSQKRTLRQEIVPSWIWTFEQLQGIFYVVVPIRMTVVRLQTGGLLVYAPVAPTPECLRLVNELVKDYGEVKYIILPTISGLEHKVFVGPFARCFPHAQVYTAPGQWSFPLNLPLSWLGFPPERTHVLTRDASQAPFYEEFDYQILGPLDLRLGLFGEVAFFHRQTQTVLVTDSVVSIPNDPPAIVQLDPYPLLFHAKDNASDPVVDTPETRRRGWQRICLFALYFQSSSLQIPYWKKVLGDAIQSPSRQAKDYFGLYPFQWRSSWPQTFASLQGEGRLIVAPILQELILNRYPAETLAWADKVAFWPMKRLISCHFAAPLATSSAQFRQAFAFLQYSPPVSQPLPQDDLRTLQSIDRLLVRFWITPDKAPLTQESFPVKSDP